MKTSRRLWLGYWTHVLDKSHLVGRFVEGVPFSGNAVAKELVHASPATRSATPARSAASASMCTDGVMNSAGRVKSEPPRQIRVIALHPARPAPPSAVVVRETAIAVGSMTTSALRRTDALSPPALTRIVLGVSGGEQE